MPDFPVISGVADLPKFYFPQGAPFRLTLSIGAEFSMTGKFVAFGMRARSGTIRRIFGTDSGESNLTVAGQVITLNIATDAATVPAFAYGWTLEDVQAHLQTEYWVDISATEGSDILLRLQGQLDWVEPGSDIAESSAIVESPSIDVAINSGAISASISVLGAAEPTLTTNTVTSGLSGILKAASNTLEVAVAGTDYVATNDSRLTDARTPTSHVHGGISNTGAIGSTAGLPIKTGTSGVLEVGAFGTSAGQFAQGNDSRFSDARTPTSHTHGSISNAGAIGSTSGLPIKTGTSGVLEVGAFGTSAGQFAQGNDSRFHDRSHAITSTSDHTAGNWKVFHSNASGQIVELALGADGTFLKSNGASLAPSFATPAGGGSSITGTGFAYVRTGGNDTTGTIGDPSKPYATAQAAWNLGARIFELGAGSFSISHTTDVPSGGGSFENVFVRGLGKERTTLSITWTGSTGTPSGDYLYPGSPGSNPIGLKLSSDKSVDFTLALSGGTGGNGSQGQEGGSEYQSGDGSAGGAGGEAPDFVAYNCFISSYSNVGGVGGQGGPPGVNGGGGLGSQGAQGATGGTPNDPQFYWSDLPNSYAENLSFLQGCITNDLFYANIPSGTVSYGASTVEAAIGTLGLRAAPEHYMRVDDFFNSSGVLSNVTGLSCSVVAGESVLIEIVGFRVGGAAGSGLQIAFTGPSSPDHVRYTLEHWNAVNTGRTVAAATAFATTLTQADGSTDALPIRVTLTLINGVNAGTVQFRAASENSGTSITFLKGLTMRVHRIS